MGWETPEGRVRSIPLPRNVPIHMRNWHDGLFMEHRDAHQHRLHHERGKEGGLISPYFHAEPHRHPGLPEFEPIWGDEAFESRGIRGGHPRRRPAPAHRHTHGRAR